MIPDDPQYQPVPYTHARFLVGTTVYIDPAILAIHPLSPCAGQVMTVCAGVYYPILEDIETRKYDTYVPVHFDDGQVYMVEEEYVFVQLP
jgi:hypothetical protein